MDVIVIIQEDRFGNLLVEEAEGSESLFFQGDDVDHFLHDILPVTFHEEYAGKKNARDKVNELIEDIKGGYPTQALISSLYFGDSYNENNTIPFTTINPNDEPPNGNPVSTGICEKCGINVLNLYRSNEYVVGERVGRFAYICTYCYKKEQQIPYEEVPMCPIGTITVIVEDKKNDS